MPYRLTIGGMNCTHLSQNPSRLSTSTPPTLHSCQTLNLYLKSLCPLLRTQLNATLNQTNTIPNPQSKQKKERRGCSPYRTSTVIPCPHSPYVISIAPLPFIFPNSPSPRSTLHSSLPDMQSLPLTTHPALASEKSESYTTSNSSESKKLSAKNCLFSLRIIPFHKLGFTVGTSSPG